MEICVSFVRWKPGETIAIGALLSSVAAFGRKRSAVTVAPDLPAIFSPVTSMELPAVCSADAPPAPAKMRARQMTIRQKSSTLRGFVSAAGPVWPAVSCGWNTVDTVDTRGFYFPFSVT